MSILQVNGTSLLGATHLEAVRSLRAMGDKLSILVCDGYDPSKVPDILPGQGSPVASIDRSNKNQSQESIDRDFPSGERAYQDIREEIRRQVTQHTSRTSVGRENGISQLESRSNETDVTHFRLSLENKVTQPISRSNATDVTHFRKS